MISNENKFKVQKIDTPLPIIIEEEQETVEEPVDTEPVEDDDVKWARSPALAKAQKKYYLKNKDKLITDQMKYNYKYVRQEITCECGDTHKYSAKYLHMRSKRHERRMKLIEEGKNPDTRTCNTKTTCECGASFLRRNKKQHERSAKHQTYLSIIY